MIPPGSIVETPIIQTPIPEDPLKTRFGETTNQCQAIGQSVKNNETPIEKCFIILFYFCSVIHMNNAVRKIV
jgi:hypothetical protein